MDPSTSIGLVVLCLLWAASVFLYFAPAIVASRRKHPSKTAILVLNLALGWLLVPWVIALVWALNAPKIEGDQAGDRFVRCPYCAEPIRAEAIKCRHCGSDLPPVLPR